MDKNPQLQAIEILKIYDGGNGDFDFRGAYELLKNDLGISDAIRKDLVNAFNTAKIEDKDSFREFLSFRTSKNSKYNFGEIQQFKKTIKQGEKFPADCFPKPYSDYTKALADSLQVDVSMVGMAVLSVLSVISQQYISIQLKEDWKEPLNLYGIAVASPGERKSAVLQRAFKPIWEYQNNANAHILHQMQENEVKIEILNNTYSKAIKKGETNEAIRIKDELERLENAHTIQLLVDDTTPEALTEIMLNNNEAAAIISAEGGVFGMLSGRYTRCPNLDLFLKSFSNEPFVVNRVGRCEQLNNPKLTMLLFVQPIVVSEAFSQKQFRERGLMGRFLYCCPPSKMGNRKLNALPIDTTIESAYERAVIEILTSINSNIILTLDDDAVNVSTEFFDYIESRLTTEYASFTDWAGKVHGTTMRIAGLLHVARYGADCGNHKVDKQTMKNAVKLGKYFILQAVDLFGDNTNLDSDIIKDSKYLLNKLIEIEPSVVGEPLIIPKQVVWQKVKGHFSSKNSGFMAALCELQDRNFIRTGIVANENGGRPKEIIILNNQIDY